jgi:GMP synthase (glutamine-hydrolysing)
MRIDVIDNGGQWTHKEWHLLKSLGIESDIKPNTVSSESLKDNDGLVLSGGAPSIVSELDKLGNVSSFIDDHSFPILGICVGAQFIALHYGGEVGPGTRPEYGKTKVDVLNKIGIFNGIPDSIIVWENHNDEIKKLPSELTLVARSSNCAVQAFAHRTLPIYGVQYHPEVNNTEYGRELFVNFVNICKETGPDKFKNKTSIL